MHKSVLLFNLAQCQTAMKLFPEAIETYKELILIDPNDADYKIKLAEILIINESYEEALSQLLKAETINPALQSIFILMEECLSNQSNQCINKRI